MIVTFTRLVLPDADLEAEEAALVETAKRWALAANPDGPAPEISTNRSELLLFTSLQRWIQLEAKVEVPEWPTSIPQRPHEPELLAGEG